MKFVFPRDRVIATTAGHVLRFEKGVPTHVPPECYREIMAVGGIPEDESFDPEAPKDDGPQEPTDPIERKKALFAAFEAITLRNKREEFTAGGVPHAKALKAHLGWSVDNRERDASWVEFTAGKKDD